jgi:acyl-CoA dehydrogenase
MERFWSDEALEFEAGVRGALLRAGGIELARRSEVDPSVRRTVVKPIVDELGIRELDLTGGETEAAAAVLAVWAAGAFVCPWPLVQQLAVPSAFRSDVDAVYLRDGVVRRAEHLDIVGRAVAVDFVTREPRLLGILETGTCNGSGTDVSHMPLDPFGVRCELGANAFDLTTAVDAYVVLAAFWTVGALGSARDLAAEHARDRHQFGRRIADFGGVQWHLSDIALAHDGLWELASFSLARLIDRTLTATDTLALQFLMLDSAQKVFSHAHQVLAAIGLCDEHDLTVLERHVQPLLRRPCGITRALGLLADEVARSGFDNLYPIPAMVPTVARGHQGGEMQVVKEWSA